MRLMLILLTLNIPLSTTISFAQKLTHEAKVYIVTAEVGLQTAKSINDMYYREYTKLEGKKYRLSTCRNDIDFKTIERDNLWVFEEAVRIGNMKGDLHFQYAIHNLHLLYGKVIQELMTIYYIDFNITCNAILPHYEKTCKQKGNCYQKGSKDWDDMVKNWEKGKTKFREIDEYILLVHTEIEKLKRIDSK